MRVADNSVNPTIVLETGGSDSVIAVAFHPDRKILLGGGGDGIRGWRLADGQEVGKQTGMKVWAIAVSKDHKWVVCGTDKGASVWDAELHNKIFEVEGTSKVYAVDLSPDLTRFATGTGRSEASVWNITSGGRLVGPLEHDDWVIGVRFSPSGEHIATFIPGGSVRIFDSHNGGQLLDIKAERQSKCPLGVTPLAWSNDGKEISTITNNNKIKSFTISTGSQLAESPILIYERSISLAGNGKFIATVADHAISFLDSSTLAKIGTAIEDSKEMRSIAISLDSSRIATGRADGKIILYDLASFLPDSYGPFHVSIFPFIVLAFRMSNIVSPIIPGTTSRRAAFDLGRP